MRIVTPALLLLAVFALPPAANAQLNENGFSISLSVGTSRIRDEDGTDTFSGSSFGYAADIEYRFTRHFALGFGGFSLGRADDDFGGVDTEISVRGYNFFGRAIFPVSEFTEVYGRLGAANYFVDIDPGTVSFDDALFGEDAVELGLGVDIGRRENLAFRIEGRYLNGGKDETGTLLTIGVNYLF